MRFVNRRSNGRRLVEVFYTPPGDEGDGGDAEPPGSGKARLRPCEASVRPWSGPVEKPPAQARKRPLWGRWGPVLGETAGLGKLAKPVGRNRRPCRSLRPWQELRGTQNLSRSRQETSGIKAFFPDFSPGKQSAWLSCLAQRRGGCLACRLGRLGAAPLGALAPPAPVIGTDKE